MSLHPLLPAGSTKGATPPDHEKVREAARGFEGLFLAQLLKIMKSSIPKGKDQTLLQSDVMSDFADLEFARVLAQRRGIGLSEMLYRSLAPDAGKAPTVERDAPGLPLRRSEKASVHMKKAPLPLPPKTEVHPMALPLKSAAPYEPIIERTAQRHGLHPELLRAVIACESSGNPKAVSPQGAKGLMQLTDSTAQMLGVHDVWDPEENLEGGARYLKSLLERFGHRLDWALAAYNAGPTAVERHQGVPPFDETERYVRRVLDRFHGAGTEARHGS